MKALPCTIEVHQTREQWLAARGLGGSDAPTILGYGYESPLELWGRLTGKLPPRDDEKVERRLRVGRALEGFIHTEAEEELKTPLVHPGDHTLFRSVERPWQTATPDRFVTNPAKPFKVVGRDPATALASLIRRGVITEPAQFKTVGSFVAKEWDEEPPPYVLIQVQHELLVTGMEAAWLVAMFGLGDELRCYHLKRHERLQEEILRAELEFRRRVDEDTPPPVDGSDMTKRALSKMFPSSGAGEILLGPEFVEIHRRLVDAKKAEAALKEERALLENTLKLAIGAHSKAVILDEQTCPVGAYSWKEQTRVDPPTLEPKTVTSRPFREVKP